MGTPRARADSWSSVADRTSSSDTGWKFSFTAQLAVGRVEPPDDTLPAAGDRPVGQAWVRSEVEASGDVRGVHGAVRQVRRREA